MQNSQENSKLGDFKFNSVPVDDEPSRSLQYCLDVSGINFSNGGIYSQLLWTKLVVESALKLKMVNCLRNCN
ncbi:unnamed protein product [Ambrosiozyma monospora]|uniref:Unnamed protein product n=1 Tax=Ambrosiozyma monospora TaxID=43982 RepID=A0ACB5SZN3_AMBMO|nr:unnamed protein product [Ambrosiozyma monospora]